MKTKITWILLAILMMASCKKEPGIGGDAIIYGQVWVKDYNGSFTSVIGEYPAKDEYVYIVFGERTGYDKRIKTDYAGNFRFEFLYPGDYTIYCYSADSTQTELDGQIPVIKKTTITDRKQNLNLGLITIAK